MTTKWLLFIAVLLGFLFQPSLVFASVSVSRVIIVEPSSTPTITPTPTVTPTPTITPTPTSTPTPTLTPTATTTPSPTPTIINHSPVFLSVINNSPQEVDNTITWTTQAYDSDPGDQVYLLVCKTPHLNGFDCEGGSTFRYCQSSLVTANPICSYTIPFGTAPGTQNAYVFILDNHYLPSVSPLQSTASHFLVTNTPPLISNISINNNQNIHLTEGTTTNISINSRIADPNGCGDIASQVVSFYRSGVGKQHCSQLGDTNNNSCFANIVCRPSNSCQNSSSLDFVCTLSLPYYTDPTDINTPQVDQEWSASLTAIDSTGAEARLDSPTGVEVFSLVAAEILDDKVSTNPFFTKELTFIPTGNVGLDMEVAADESVGTSILSNSFQHFTNQSTINFTDAPAFSKIPQELELNISKPHGVGQITSSKLWWGLNLPSDISSQNYHATNTFYAVRGELGQW